MEVPRAVAVYTEAPEWPRLLQDTLAEARAEAFKDAEVTAQLFSAVFFTGLGTWLLFANGTKLSFVQRASLEKRLTVCCFINTYVALFSAFFNFFQLTEVDNIVLPRATNFTLDFSRPVEWIVTCPMMQLVLVLMGGSRIPEYRRWFMPLLSTLILVCGTTTMLLGEDWRYLFFGLGFVIALTMWFHNARQIQEHSNGEETMFRGDSEFRKASILLIATWFPFPIWFFISPEGVGLLTDVLIIQVGWAFLNITSKFTFIFYIQRIKDNYCSRVKVKREVYGMSQGEDANGGVAEKVNNGTVSTFEQDKHSGELRSVVVETMTFLGMAQHTERFTRLLRRADITSPQMVEALDRRRCEELQLPWDLISALQRRIQVWQLEMRDEAEIELERGELHYKAEDKNVVKSDTEEHVINGVAPTDQFAMVLPGGMEPANPTQTHSKIGWVKETDPEALERIDSRLERIETLVASVMQSANYIRQHQQWHEQPPPPPPPPPQQLCGQDAERLRRVEELMAKTAEGTERTATVLSDMRQGQVESLRAQGTDYERLRRLEELVSESADRGEKAAHHLGRTLQAQLDSVHAAAMRQHQQAGSEAPTSWKIEELVDKAVAKSTTDLTSKAEENSFLTAKMELISASQLRHQSAMEGVYRKIEEATDSVQSTVNAAVEDLMSRLVRRAMEAEGGMTRRLEEMIQKAVTSADKATDSVRKIVLSQDELLRGRLPNEMAAILARSDGIAEAIREGRETQKEFNADIRRHCIMVLDQVNESQERAHNNAGQVTKLQRAVENNTTRILRALSDAGIASEQNYMNQQSHTQPSTNGSKTSLSRSVVTRADGEDGGRAHSLSGPGSGQPQMFEDQVMTSRGSAVNLLGTRQHHQLVGSGAPGAVVTFGGPGSLSGGAGGSGVMGAVVGGSSGGSNGGSSGGLGGLGGGGGGGGAAAGAAASATGPFASSSHQVHSSGPGEDHARWNGSTARYGMQVLGKP